LTYGKGKFTIVVRVVRDGKVISHETVKVTFK
jgi:hypothetical protein